MFSKAKKPLVDSELRGSKAVPH